MGQSVGRAAAKTASKAATSAPTPPTSTVMHGGHRVLARPTAGGGVSAQTRVKRMGPEELQAMAEAAAASRYVPYDESEAAASAKLLHLKDPGLVKGLTQLAGEGGLDTIQARPHRESQEQLTRYYEAQLAARSAPLPEISQGGQGQQRPSEANVEDQVVLSDHRTDADLIDERDLAEILNLHKAKPEIWDAAALAAKYNANVHMLTAVLSSVTLPVHVKDENDTYGVWDVLD